MLSNQFASSTDSSEHVALEIKVAFEATSHELVVATLTSGAHEFIALTAVVHRRSVRNVATGIAFVVHATCVSIPSTLTSITRQIDI